MLTFRNIAFNRNIKDNASMYSIFYNSKQRWISIDRF